MAKKDYSVPVVELFCYPGVNSVLCNSFDGGTLQQMHEVTDDSWEQLD